MRLKEFNFFLIIFGFLYLTGLLSTIKESFVNPFEEIIKKIKQMQDQVGAYDRWIGYVYKHSSKNGLILNDFKSRVFQPTCKFRSDWATRLPKNKTIPTPADTPELAMMSYKKYLDALSKGKGDSAKQLYDARDRFMAPGCDFLNDPSRYTKPFNVGFK
jgi:hypothetical protein